MRPLVQSALACAILAALLLGLGVVLGVTGGEVVVLVALGALAMAFTLALGLLAERASARRLGTLAGALGLTRSEAQAEPIIAALTARLEQALPSRTALRAMALPMLIADAGGRILCASAGMRALLGPIEQGMVNASLGLNPHDGDGVLVAGQRFAVERRALGGHVLITLNPSGHVLPEDELEAFAEALRMGQTGFRFDPDAVARLPGLGLLNLGMETIDRSASSLRRLASGEALNSWELQRSGAWADEIRGIGALLRAANEERDAAAAARDRLAHGLEAAGQGMDRHRAATERLAQCGQAMRRGHEAARQALRLGLAAIAPTRAGAEEAQDLAQESASAAQSARASQARLLALMAQLATQATELARAVHAPEAQAQLRDMSGRLEHGLHALRGQAGLAESELVDLANLVEALGQHLRNFRSAADTIGAAVETGQQALQHLDAQVLAVEAEAERALALPKRQARRA